MDEDLKKSGEEMPENVDSSEKEKNGREVLNEYFKTKAHVLGDSAEKKLNAMEVGKRKLWFFIVFGLLLFVLLFNFFRSFVLRPDDAPTAKDIVMDSVFNWSQVDEKDLSVIDLDSTKAMKDSVKGSAEEDKELYFK